MKIEIEISDAELQEAVTRKVKAAVADITNHWQSDDYIKAQAKEQWKSAVDAAILEVFSDSAAIRAKIVSELEKKIRAQLAAAMKAAG